MAKLVVFSYAKSLEFNSCGGVGQYVNVQGQEMILLTDGQIEDLAMLSKLKVIAMDDSENENKYAKVKMEIISDPVAITAFQTLSKFSLMRQINEVLEGDGESLVSFEPSELEQRPLTSIRSVWVQIPTDLIKMLKEWNDFDSKSDKESGKEYNVAGYNANVEIWRRNTDLVKAVLEYYFINNQGIEFETDVEEDIAFIWKRAFGKRKITASFTLHSVKEFVVAESDIEYLALVKITFIRKDKRIVRYVIYLSNLAFWIRRYIELNNFDKLDNIFRLIPHNLLTNY